MSSFYGGGGGVTGSNYDSLKNAPVKNVGTNNTTTYLSGLDYGHYNLKGNYAGSLSGEVVTNTEALDIMVVKDEKTNKKVIYFFTVENSETIINNYIYDEYGELDKETHHILSDVAHPQWEELEE